MNTFYFLQTCDTCKRIMKELGSLKKGQNRELKSNPLDEATIDRLAKKAGSYEAIFNKRARLLAENGLKAAELAESDFRALLLTHYSYLKRPILETPNHLVAGNSAAAVAEMKGLA